MTKVTLNDVGNLIDATTAQTTINNNNDTIVTAFDNTLSRDGTNPNTMGAAIDMNTHAIVNLPSPIGATSPLRLQDLIDFNGGGTIQTLPAGGTTGQSLQKASNTNYDFTFGNSVSSVGLSLPADFTVTNSPVTSTGTLTGNWATPPTGTGPVVRGTSPTINTPTLSNPTSTTGTFTSPVLVTPALGTPTSGTLTNTTGFPVANLAGLGTNVGTFLVTPTSANLAAAVTNETGSGLLVFNAAPTLTTPVISSISNTGTLTLPTSTDTLIGKATTDVLTNKTFNSTGTGNVLQVSGVTVSAGQYPGEPTTGSATAGNVGEYSENVIPSGSAVALTTATAKTIAQITLGAGDWDIRGMFVLFPANTTQVTAIAATISLVTNTLDTTVGRYNQPPMGSITYNGTTAATLPIAPYRFSLSTSTTIFLVGFAAFTVSTCNAYGMISARRAR